MRCSERSLVNTPGMNRGLKACSDLCKNGCTASDPIWGVALRMWTQGTMCASVSPRLAVPGEYE